jgi:hypothetical protein
MTPGAAPTFAFRDCVLSMLSVLCQGLAQCAEVYDFASSQRPARGVRADYPDVSALSGSLLSKTEAPSGFPKQTSPELLGTSKPRWLRRVPEAAQFGVTRRCWG